MRRGENYVMCITRLRAPSGISLHRIKWQGPAWSMEHRMSDDTKLGFILLFVVFALMVIGPVLAG